MYRVIWDEKEKQWCVEGNDRCFFWYSSELAHLQKDALNLLVDLGFTVSITRGNV